ncbi:MAG: hypothetical protein E4H40_02935 [Candidatus Brocadiia bacterium]|nr:MAG: hypothetical protein E4H40_02935 [Candidatus Brocadiia bacterium]
MRKIKPQIGNNVYINEVPGLLDVAMVAGRVSQCKRNEKNPMLWDATVKPVCDIQSLNAVAIIIMNPEH